MKMNLAMYITTLTLLAVLAVPVQLAAQDKRDHGAKVHHYQLADIGTFGGPDVSLAVQPIAQITPFSQRNARGSAASAVSVTVMGGFSGAVTLTCSVQPKPALAPQCSVPSSITPGTPVTLTVTTTGSTMSAAHSDSGNELFYAASLPLEL